MHSPREESDSADQRLRVVLLTSSLERGGAERQVIELANGLDPARFRVNVVSLSEENPLAADLRDAQSRLIVVPKRRKYDLALIAKIARLLSRLKTDVVHSFLFDAEIVGRLAGRIARVPAVICSNRCPHQGRAAFKLHVARLTSGCFDLMIANSWAGFEFERDEQGIDPARLCVIPNGIDTARFSPGRNDALRAELGISIAAPVIGMIAHFRGNKDHGTLIEAAARVLSEHPDARFVLVGAPDAGSNSIHVRCTKAINRLGIGQQVLLTGPRSDIPKLYRMMDINVLSTKFEGTPNVVLEAMACGLPVIATDVSDNRRLVVDGRTGFVVPPADAASLAARISQLIHDAGLRRALGADGRLRAETEYSTRALAERTANAYLSVLAQKGRARATPLLAAAGSDAGCAD